jgi:NDP-sugar pyrophosphorylase family protein
MKAVVLAGGKGRRLAPYTAVFPKPLVPLGDRPILDIIIRQLIHYDFQDIILSVGHLAELIQAYFENCSIDFLHGRLTYVRESEPMGTAGSLGLVPDLNDTFLVMNGDILTSMDYSKLVDYHKEKGGILTIGMHKKTVKIELGVIETDGDGILNGYIEKPENAYMVSMGVYVYESSVLDYIERGVYLDFPDLVLRLMNSGERVVGYPCEDHWLDIGRHEDYGFAQTGFERMKDTFLPASPK